jgi:hypothetical protein
MEAGPSAEIAKLKIAKLKHGFVRIDKVGG